MTEPRLIACACIYWFWLFLDIETSEQKHWQGLLEPHTLEDLGTGNNNAGEKPITNHIPAGSQPQL